MKIVNPKMVVEREIDGYKFKVGIIPFGKKTEIEAVAFFSGKVETPEQVENLVKQGYQYVKYGIKGHTGLRFDESSEEVPFTQDSDGSVSEETMAVYAASPGLLAKLSAAVTELNYLKKESAKN